MKSWQLLSLLLVPFSHPATAHEDAEPEPEPASDGRIRVLCYSNTADWTNEPPGEVRFFYTELGHDLRSLDTDFGKKHVVEAIRWAAASKDAKAK